MRAKQTVHRKCAEVRAGSRRCGRGQVEFIMAGAMINTQVHAVSLHFTGTAFFYKLKVCGNSTRSKSTSAIFLTAFSHFVFTSHSWNSQNISNLSPLKRLQLTEGSDGGYHFLAIKYFFIKVVFGHNSIKHLLDYHIWLQYDFFKRIFIYLAALGLSCGTQALQLQHVNPQLQHVGSSSPTRDGTWPPWVGSIES